MAVFVFSLALYCSSLSSQPWTGDTAEYQTVPYILGIPHPTGFPAYVLLGWLFSHALPLGTVAWRMNLLSALLTALTAAEVSVLALMLDANPLAALAAGIVFSVGGIVWHAGVMASAHALSAALIVAALVAAVAFARWANPRALWTACGCAGVGLAAQPEALWVLPAILVAALWQWRTLSLRSGAAAIALVVAPLAFYAYLPIRSAVVESQHLDPTASPPFYGTGTIDWDTNHPRTIPGFLDEVLARHELTGAVATHTVNVKSPLSEFMFWGDHLLEEFTPTVLVLGGLGIATLAMRDPRALSVLGAGTLGGLLFSYGFRLDVELYRYFVVASAVVAALAAAASRLPLSGVRPRFVSDVVTVGLLLAAVLTVSDHRNYAAEYRSTSAQATIDAVRQDVPEGGVIVANWYDATTLAYGAFIEHALGTRTVVHALPYRIVPMLRMWSASRHLYLVGYTTEVETDVLPARWFHDVPTTLRGYRIVEVSR